LVKRAVESVLRETTTRVRIYVADAGSTDGTIKYLQSIAGESVVPVLAGRKLGQAKAYNDIFKTIETPYVAWLSDDNEVVNNGLDLAVRILDEDPRIGMVGLKVKDVQGPFVHAPYIGGVSEVGILNVNQGLLRTQVLRDVGYFSETFGFYGIDPDLTAKVLLSGHDIVYTKRVALHHYRDWADDPSSSAYVALTDNQQRSLRLYRQKYHAILPRNRYWETKQRLWKSLWPKLCARFQPAPTASFLGAIPRDWENIFYGRHISLFDSLIHWRDDYHLRQHVRPWRRPATVPEDPVIATEER
jgi:GT2 family glycosyltransferase